MKPPKFKYIAPESPEAVVQFLADYDGEARCLSGGQSLIPLMNYRLVQPAALIDLNRCPGLSYLHRDGEMLVIGPMTRQAAVEHELADLGEIARPQAQAPRGAGIAVRHRSPFPVVDAQRVEQHLLGDRSMGLAATFFRRAPITSALPLL